MYPDLPPGTESLLAKHMTRTLFEDLKDLKTSMGVTVHDCIISGVEHLDSKVGVYAGDAECYVLFAPLMNPIISDLHSGMAISKVCRT